MTLRKLAVLSAGLSQPSSTRMLADQLSAATASRLREQGFEVEVTTVELRDVAVDVMNNMLTGFPSPKLESVIEAVTGADGLIAVTPIFSASYSGLFKSFFDVIDKQALADMPVVIGATAGTPRHSLALDHALRPLFTYLHANVAGTGVFAATGDWGQSGPGAQASVDAQALPGRIERAAGELAALMRDSDRSAQLRDPFGFDSVISGVGGFQPS